MADCANVLAAWGAATPSVTIATSSAAPSAVVAVVVVKQGHALDEPAVLAQCATAMAGFKGPMRAVFAEALPKNPSGKLLKRQLREAHAAVFANP